MCKIQLEFNTEAEREAYLNGYELAKKMFKRQRAEWWPTDEMGYMVRCSECNFVTHEDVSEEYKFCPNCGADMRKKRGETK